MSEFGDGVKLGVAMVLASGLALMALVTVVAAIAEDSVYSRIREQCDGRYREFEMDGKYYSCQEKPVDK